MPRKPDHGFERRKREQARKERAAARRERREARRSRDSGEQEIDDVVMGPQSMESASDAEVLQAIERAMNPGKAAREAPRTRHPARAAAARLFVGNLDFSYDERAVRDLFKEAGFSLVEATLVRDRDTGESRGFAFVELAKPEEAQQVIEALDGEIVGGRPLRVNLAEERSGR